MNTYLWQNDQQCGPYDDAQIHAYLQDGTLSYEDMAWREGLPNWQPLRTFYPPPVQPPQSPVPPSLPQSPEKPSSPFASPIVKYGGGCILLIMAFCVVGIIYVFVTRIKDSFARPMPITVENLQQLTDRRLAGFNKKFSDPIIPKGELTQRPLPVAKLDEHLQLLMIDKEAIEEMGYNYNSTVMKIAQSYAAIREYPVFGDMALNIARNAYATRQEAVRRQIITPETVDALEAMPKTE